MPDRIADEKKVVALMIRMYCRRHCRQQSQNIKTDQTNQANKPSRTGDTSQTDTANQPIRTNQFNQTDRTGDTNQADNSSRTDPRLVCPECAALLDYALRRLDSCRFGNDKPTANARSTATAQT